MSTGTKYALRPRFIPYKLNNYGESERLELGWLEAWPSSCLSKIFCLIYILFSKILAISICLSKLSPLTSSQLFSLSVSLEVQDTKLFKFSSCFLHFTHILSLYFQDWNSLISNVLDIKLKIVLYNDKLTFSFKYSFISNLKTIYF